MSDRPDSTPDPNPRIPAYILAGGHSSRFGSDKARALVHGKPNILRLANKLATRGHAVAAVAQTPGTYDDLGIRTIADRATSCGPLAGLEAAVTDAAANHQPLLLLVACDMLDFDGAWIDLLVQARQHAPAAAFRDQNWQPLFSVVHTEIAPSIASALKTDDRSLRGLFERVGAHAVEPPSDWHRFAQANTPDELDAFNQRMRQRPDASIASPEHGCS